MSESGLRVFISSTMDELKDEREVIKEAYSRMGVSAWTFEHDAGAQPISGQQAYKDEIDESNYYVGIFWRHYGAYTIDEFEYATDKGKPRFIYEKRLDIEGKRDPELDNFLKKAGNVETGVAVRWFNTVEELAESARNDMRKEQRKTRERLDAALENPINSKEQSSLNKLRRKVKRSWIDGMLARITSGTGLVDLGKDTQPGAIGDTLEGLVDKADEESRVLEPGMGIDDVFDDVDKSLLILGQPGSGKTTSLLILAKELLERAEMNNALPIPVVFNLSSGVDADLSLKEWLVTELRNKYEIPAEIGESYLDNHRLYLFLDGLDEVARENRELCVDAINQYTKDVGYPGIVVCCRADEYEELEVKLSLTGAIYLRPLSETQIDGYLADAGPELAGLHGAIQEDDALHDLARSPLMLNLMCVTYVGYEKEDFARGRAPEERSNALFSAYIDKMFAKKGNEEDLAWPREKLMGWLSWIAKRLQDRSQTMFRIEGLQPAWLEGAGQRFGYVVAFSFSVGIFLAIASILFRGAGNFDQAAIGDDGYKFLKDGEIVIWLSVTPIWLLAYSLIENLGSRSGTSFLERPPAGLLRAAVKCITSAVLWIAVTIACVELLLGNSGAEVRGAVMWSGIAISVIVGVLGAERSVNLNIQTVETLRWASSRNAWTWALFGMAGGAIIGGAMIPLDLLNDKIPAGAPTWAQWVPVVDFMLVLMIVGALIGGLTPRVEDSKTVPNQGVKLSAWMGLRMAAHSTWIVGVAWGISLLGGYTYTPDPRLKIGEFCVPMLGNLVGLFTILFLVFGGLDVFKHYILRALMAINGQIPWNIARLLGDAHRLDLMHRAGNAYLFKHRRLRDHLASGGGTNS